MAKKTSVLLPGGIQGLVNDLQRGESRYQPQPLVDGEQAVKDAERDGTDEQNGAEQGGATHAEEAAGARSTDQQSGMAAESGVEAQGYGSDSGAKTAATASQNDAEKGRGEAGQETTGRGRRPKDPEVKTYNVVKDNSEDSWQLFVDMAREYKQAGGKLATIYIDPALKSVLDRLKYLGPEKFPTSAILSSIVARFIYDHEEDIKKIIFNQRLL